MMSQPGKKTITIHIFPNFSGSTGNQTVKFSQVEYNNRNITRGIFFFRNHGDNDAGRLAPDHFLFFEKALYEE